MERKVYDTYKELADDMRKAADNGEVVYAILFYDDAAKLTQELLKDERANVMDLEIAAPEMNGYGLEYFVTIDDEYDVFVEPAWRGECELPNGETAPSGYLMYWADKVFIHGDANSALLEFVDKKTCCEIAFAADEADEKDCQKDENKCDGDSKIVVKISKEDFNHLLGNAVIDLTDLSLDWLDWLL